MTTPKPTTHDEFMAQYREFVDIYRQLSRVSWPLPPAAPEPAPEAEAAAASSPGAAADPELDDFTGGEYRPPVLSIVATYPQRDGTPEMIRVEVNAVPDDPDTDLGAGFVAGVVAALRQAPSAAGAKHQYTFVDRGPVMTPGAALMRHLAVSDLSRRKAF